MPLANAISLAATGKLAQSGKQAPEPTTPSHRCEKSKPFVVPTVTTTPEPTGIGNRGGGSEQSAVADPNAETNWAARFS